MQAIPKGLGQNFGSIVNLIERVRAGEISTYEFPERFLPLWADYGKGYRQKGITDADIVELLRLDDPQVWFSKDDYTDYLAAPDSDTIELYRGASAQRPNGISWTNDFSVASVFALMKGELAAVATANVPITALLGGIEMQYKPGLYEYLVDPAMVSDLKLTPVQDHRVLDAATSEVDYRLENGLFKRSQVSAIRLKHRAMEYRNG